jgi:glycosyltransferase involved in cell wall biosynthesis
MKITVTYIMENKPIVTIGLCARNAQHTIRQAIESIIAQDFPKEFMEIIFVDDGSEDETLYIMRQYASKMTIKCRIFGGIRIGLGEARNLVVWNATGKYIIWVDADMILPEDHVRKQVKFMQDNPKVAIAGARFYGLPEKDLLVDLQNLEWMAINYINMNNLKPNMSCAVCGGAIYRTEAIRQVGGFDAKVIGAGEDEELEWKISNSGWKIQKGTDAYFFERRKKGWKAIWNQFFWYGYGKHYLVHKKKTVIKPSQLLEGLVLSAIAYRLTGRKVAFLLPIQYYFKRIAWFFGFTRAHIKGYGHS